MKLPTTMTELRRILSMINWQSKFTPHLADHTKKALRDLLSSRNKHSWVSEQKRTFESLKQSHTEF